MGEKFSKKIVLIGITFLFAILISSAVSAADADIQVNQTVSNSTPNLNDNVTFNTTVTNNGPDTATGVQVTNKLPSGVVLNNYTASQGTYNTSTGIWNIGTLTSGQIATLFLNTTINQTGVIKDIANKTAEIENDPNSDNNAQETILNVPNAVDISVTQAPWYVDTTIYARNNAPVMAVTVTNSALYDDANGVVVEYIIGSGYEYNGCDTRGSGTATYNSTTRTLTWNIGYLPKGGTAYLSIFLQNNQTGNYNPGTTNDNLTNIARLKSLAEGYTDINNNNNQQNATLQIPTSSDISVTQTTETTTPNYQQNITFTITVTNNGPDTAHNIQITDKLPAGLVWVSDTGNNTYDHTTGIWTIGTLTNGQTITLNITALVNATGTIKNTASRTKITEVDWTKNNNQQTIILTVPQASDIGVNQTINNTTPNYLDTVTVTVYATNYGPDFATNVKITDLLSPGLEYVSSTTNHGNYTNGVWTLNNLQNGETATLTILARVIEACEFNNTVTRTGGSQYDYNPANDVKNVTLTIPEAAYVQVNKTVSNTTPNYQDTVTYTITATNNGPDNATGVNINYNLPTGIILTGSSATQGTYNNGIWNIGTLTPGQNVTLTLTALVNTTGTITDNNLTTTQDQYKYNNTLPAQNNLTIPAAAYIEVTKDVTPSNPNYQDTVTYTITVTNKGPNIATGANVNYTLPDGLILTGSNTLKGSYTNGIWDIGTLNIGETATLTITAKINATGIITDNSLTTTQNQYKYNNTLPSPINFNIPAAAHVAITNTATPNTINNGDTTTFTVNVTNNGPDTVTNLNITNILNGLTFQSASATSGSYSGGIWTITSLAKGATATLTIIAKATTQLSSAITATLNSATTSQDQTEPTGQTHENKTASVIVNPAAHVNITNTASTSTPNYYSPVTFTVTITNNGPDTVTGLQIKDLLPAGLTYMSSSAPAGTTYDSATGIWNVGTLTKNQSLTLTINANATAIGALNNVAYTYLQNQNEPTGQTHESKTTTVTVPVAADIQVTQNISNTSPTTGNNVTITVYVKNNGPSTANGVTVTDLLPSGFTYVSSSAPTGTTYNSGTGLWTVGSLTSGQQLMLTIVGNATTVGNYTNNATKTAETTYDWYTANNAQSVNLTINGNINQDTGFTDQGTQSGTINSDDGTTTVITLPFPITLYGHTYTTIYISVNGAIGLGNPIQGPTFYQTPETNSINANVAYIAPFWADFDVTYFGNITYTVTGDVINITWYKIPKYSDNQNYNLVNTVSLLMTKDGKYGFQYGALSWKNDPSASYPSYARIRLNSTTYKNFWTGAQDLSEIAGKTIWFDSNGNLLPTYADIGVDVAASTTTPRWYNHFTITITVKNNGLNSTTGVQVTDSLPNGLTYVSSTPSQGTYSSSTGIWNIGTLTSGQSVTLTLTVYATNTQTQTNTATKTAETEYDPVSTNNSDSVSIKATYY